VDISKWEEFLLEKSKFEEKGDWPPLHFLSLLPAAEEPGLRPLHEYEPPGLRDILVQQLYLK
jgi:hypothetical protein